MKKFLFPVMLTVCIGSAFAQSGSVTTSDEKGKVEAVSPAQTEAEKSADAFCLRETGSHLRAITKSHNERAVECAGAPGRSYSREDIQRTGAISTADALRRLDPSIH